MEAILKKFVDTKLGDFLQVDEENLVFSPSTGHLCLRNAELKADAFAEIHLPFTLRGGFIEEMSVNLNPSAFGPGSFGAESKKPVSVLIKNVFMVFGPHLSDWSWEHVYVCKTGLVDMIGKLLDLKSPKRKKTKKPSWNWFGDFQKRIVERMVELFMGVVEVRVSNIHFRYEDVGPALEAGPKLQNALPSVPLGTKAGPLACGCKLAYMEVKSKPHCGQECRATGYWKYASFQNATARFSQTVTTRRMSVYWDVNQNLDRFFATSSSSGAEVKRRFQKLNTRATFSDCVVETILGRFGPAHPRRGPWEGPTFRDRFDFHQYIVFPSGFNAHIRTNRENEATQKQLVPLKDADVSIDSVEVAVDTEQLRSMNALLSHVREFDQKDLLARTRPRESIFAYLSPPQDQGVAGGSQGRSSSSTSPAPGYISAERTTDKHAVVRSWWRHALNAVQIRCGTTRSCFKGLLDERLRLREQYIDLYLQELATASRDPMASSSDPSRLADRLRELQVRLSLDEILKWRTIAKEKHLEISSPPVEATMSKDVEESANSAPSNEPAARPASNTMQMQVHVQAFQAFFLVVDNLWALALQETMLRILKNTKPHQKVKALMPRSVLAKTQVLHICVEAVQKGRSRHRVARWLQIAFGTISVINCTIPRHLNGSRHILCMTPSVRRAGAKPVSMLFGFTMLQVLDNQLEAGDIPLAAVIDPAVGVAAHLEEHTAHGDDRLLEHVGFLGGKVLAPRTLSFVSVQAGQVRALYYSPFFDRIWRFLKRGRASLDVQITRRPSVDTLDRDLLAKLQRKFEFYAGKSTLYSSIEGVVGGMQARMVDTYNNTHALCKEVILTPMRMRFLRSGNPQRFQIQIHKVRPADEQPGPPVQVVDTLALLPWQVSMHLLPREDFFTYAEAGVEEKYVQQQQQQQQPQQDRAFDSCVPLPGPVVSGSHSAFDAVAEGGTFKKWCRTGRWKERFVNFQVEIEAIVWKKNQKAQTWLGILPLSKLQDICTGIETPVMKKCKDQANADCVWSLIAVDRTLDLEADSRAQRDFWVEGIKARFKLYVTQRCKNERLAESVIPRHLTQLIKVYPPNFWSGNCALRRTYYKLQAVTTVGKTLEASKAPTLAGRFVGRHHRASKLQALGKEVPSTEVASTRQVPKYGLHTKL